MFASRFCRSAQQLSSHVRRYATEPSKAGSSNAVWYGAAAAILGGGGYYIYSQQSSGTTHDSAAKSQPEAASTPAIASSRTKVFTGGEQGFVSLVLDQVEPINHNTKKFRFKFPTPDSVSGLTVASALITKFKGAEDVKPTIRPYTPVSDEDQPGYLDFIIKRYPNGPMSEHIFAMAPGQELDIKGPIPKYPYTPNKHHHIALIAGGTGITPMYQLMRAVFNNAKDKTKVTLVFGNVTEEDILLRKEFTELEQKYPDRFRAFYVLDKPPEGWQQGKGFITKDLLKTVIPGPKEENVKVFVCGPPGLYKAISGAKNSPADQGELGGHLQELGYSKDQVYKF